MDAEGMTRLLGHIWLSNGKEPDEIMELPSGKRAFALAAAEKDLENQQEQHSKTAKSIQKMFGGKG